jgi:transcription initiation factor IIE alpha subunit
LARCSGRGLVDGVFVLISSQSSSLVPSFSLPLTFDPFASHLDRMRDEELAGRVNMANKDVAKAVQKLIEDQLISV